MNGIRSFFLLMCVHKIKFLPSAYPNRLKVLFLYSAILLGKEIAALLLVIRCRVFISFETKQWNGIPLKTDTTTDEMKHRPKP